MLLRICNLNEKSKLGMHQKSQVFVNAIYRFLLGEISLDELSAIANKLWTDIDGQSDIKFGKLGNALYSCAELNFCIRRIYSREDANESTTFIVFMKKMMAYYDKKRSIVVK